MSTIKEEVLELGTIINVPNDIIDLYFGDNEITINEEGRSYRISVFERGRLISENIYIDKNKLLYDIFDGITFQMAVLYELENRLENIDSREIIFKKQLELMRLLDINWFKKLKNKINIIIEKYPTRSV